ncbi:hypothetical protein EHEL_091130 [Encephalitozoon hellem ATCC 50504]|uniref:Uncharacterized protein n=1 Tax=Encephalitozoon hellem TaxID=27973 RepID=A0A9Q9C4J4_ENCHE|nr:uncharacterized protein EHEL_091130 [Encephalitozoon hellem ATCC 50504]AFM99008.1 hypothetical protein EHEL_091130 [Encephalitozoon hellem ATCC 50504]UTX44024.1 hypothetical protein GPU96_09g18040 [Encephalitozoon hellem]WEL39509.1 hypothetical protein PFJ87_09g01370 [Encephalitozoon hellem]|eukprot:XP_003887989.1 hypothetical protein EHEL_091130 [Encephalitozoon hellem ATCC 50504]
MIEILFLGHAAATDGVPPDIWTSMSYYGDFLAERKEVAMVLFVTGLLVNFLGICAKRCSLSVIAFPVLRLSIGSIMEVVNQAVAAKYGTAENAPKAIVHVVGLLRKVDENRFFMAFLSVALGLVMFFFVKTIIYILMGYLAFHLWGVLESSAGETMGGNLYYIYQTIMLCIGILVLVLVKPITFLIYIIVFSVFGSLFVIVGANFGFNLNLDLNQYIVILRNGDFYQGLVENKISVGYISLITMGIVSQLLLRSKNEEKGN